MRNKSELKMRFRYNMLFQLESDSHIEQTVNLPALFKETNKQTENRNSPDGEVQTHLSLY